MMAKCNVAWSQSHTLKWYREVQDTLMRIPYTSKTHLAIGNQWSCLESCLQLVCFIDNVWSTCYYSKLLYFGNSAPVVRSDTAFTIYPTVGRATHIILQEVVRNRSSFPPCHVRRLQGVVVQFACVLTQGICRLGCHSCPANLLQNIKGT